MVSSVSTRPLITLCSPQYCSKKIISFSEIYVVRGKQATEGICKVTKRRVNIAADESLCFFLKQDLS